jgi:hypothetical protein
MIERRKARQYILKGALASYVVLKNNTEPIEGDAIVLNISLHGCRLECEHMPAFDQPYELVLHLPPYPRPILVQKALTRWTEGQLHGVKFVDQSRECELELREVIRQLSLRSHNADRISERG